MGVFEALALLSGLFVVVVLIQALASPGSWTEIPATYWNLANGLFFDNNDLLSNQSCGGLFDGFALTLSDSHPGQDAISVFFGGIVLIFSYLWAFIYGMFVFLQRMLSVCGIGLVRFLFGIGIILSHVYIIAIAISAVDSATAPLRSGRHR